MSCDLEYIGKIGSQPNQKIYRCNTHPHNFFWTYDPSPLFAHVTAPTECDKASELPEDQAQAARNAPRLPGM